MNLDLPVVKTDVNVTIDDNSLLKIGLVGGILLILAYLLHHLIVKVK